MPARQCRPGRVRTSVCRCSSSASKRARLRRAVLLGWITKGSQTASTSAAWKKALDVLTQALSKNAFSRLEQQSSILNLRPKLEQLLICGEERCSTDALPALPFCRRSGTVPSTSQGTPGGLHRPAQRRHPAPQFSRTAESTRSHALHRPRNLPRPAMVQGCPAAVRQPLPPQSPAPGPLSCKAALCPARWAPWLLVRASLRFGSHQSHGLGYVCSPASPQTDICHQPLPSLSMAQPQQQHDMLHEPAYPMHAHMPCLHGTLESTPMEVYQHASRLQHVTLWCSCSDAWLHGVCTLRKPASALDALPGIRGGPSRASCAPHALGDVA